MICTTIEQSKKLLELGLSPNTADMYYPTKNCAHPKTGVPLMLSSEIPAWSLSALLEFMPKSSDECWNLCYGSYDNNDVFIPKYHCDFMAITEESTWFNEDTPINAAFRMICWLLENNYISEKRI